MKERSERQTACWKTPIKSWNEFRDIKMETGTSQFCWSVRRCEAIWHGMHACMPLGCPLPAQGMLPRPRQPLWACSQGQGSSYGQAAKVRACDSQGQSMPRPRQHLMGMLPRPRHAIAKIKACSQGHGMLVPKAMAALGGCCYQAQLTSLDPSYSSPLKSA